jgi:hypothetical protein
MERSEMLGTRPMVGGALEGRTDRFRFRELAVELSLQPGLHIPPLQK